MLIKKKVCVCVCLCVFLCVTVKARLMSKALVTEHVHTLAVFRSSPARSMRGDWGSQVCQGLAVVNKSYPYKSVDIG